MDNTILIILLVVQAIAIVWLASKLKQYQNFDRMLKPDGSQSGGGASADPGMLSRQPQTRVAAATSAVAQAVNGGETDLLDMPGVEPEANIEEAKRVQLVMARCHYAEFYLEQLDDDYERGQFQKIIDSCKQTAANISDPFFRSSALQPIIMLLERAGWSEERDQLLALVDDDLIRQRIDKELKQS